MVELLPTHLEKYEKSQIGNHETPIFGVKVSKIFELPPPSDLVLSVLLCPKGNIQALKSSIQNTD